MHRAAIATAATIVTLLVCLGAFAQKAKPPIEDLKRAQKALQRGEKAEAAGNWKEALAAYREAAKYAPRDPNVIQHGAALRAKLVQKRVDAAEDAAIMGDLRRATEELRNALIIDPGNTILAERARELREMDWRQSLPAGESSGLSGAANLAQHAGVRSFTLRGDTRSAYEQVAHAFGIAVAFDPDMPTRNVKLRVQDMTFEQVMDILGTQTLTFYRIVNPTMIFVAQNTPDKRRQYEVQVEQTFPLAAVSEVQDMTEMLRAIREVTGAQHIELDSKSKSITIRDSVEKVKLAGQIIKQVERARGEVMLQIELLEVDKNGLRNLGVNPPTSAQAVALSGSEIDQLSKATDFANLLTILQGIFSARGITTAPTQFIPVGGGKSTFLLNLPGATANFADTLSTVKSGREIFMRAQDGKPATFFVGERYPVTLSLLSTSLGGTSVQSIGNSNASAFPRTDFTVGSTPVAIVIQDFNNDAQPDLAVANQGDNSVTILLNQGSGNFTQATGSPIALGANATGPAGIASGIFVNANTATNAAARVGIVTANSASNTATVLLGNGDGTFTEATGSPYPTGTQPKAVITGDFDADGNLDFAVINTGDSSISTFKGDGQGGFTPFPNSPFVLPTTQQGPIAVTTANFRSSSGTEIDFAVVNQTTNNVSILLGAGQTTFNGSFTQATGSPVSVGSGPVAIAAGDVNADGVPDLAVVNQTASNITVLLNNGDATFTEAQSSPLPTTTGANPAGVVIADFTNDGIGDVAVTNQGLSTLGIYAGLGDGLFSDRAELSVATGPRAIASADLNADGLPDAAITAFSGDTNLVTVLLDSSSFASTGATQFPYPGSEFIDLGIKVKATPSVHDNDEVTLQLEFEIRSLAGTAVNGIPVITNRTVTQTVRLKENETSLIGGLLDREETKSITGLPTFANLPGVGYAFGDRNNQNQDTELMILITPRRLRSLDRRTKSLYAGRGGASASGGSAAPINEPAAPEPTPEPGPGPTPDTQPTNPPTDNTQPGGQPPPSPDGPNQ